MKNFTFLLFLALFIANAQSQNYLINFSGSGASSSVDSVYVENLTQLTYIKLAGNDILQLKATGVGINDLIADKSIGLNIYPNPFTENSKIEFDATANGKVTVELFDITGSKVVSYENVIQKGRQVYSLNGIKSGVYTIQINSESYSYTGKIISKYEGKSAANKITYQSHSSPVQFNENKSYKGKGNTIQMQYNEGDTLKLIGQSGNYGTVVINVPNKNSTISFPFYACTDADNNNYLVVEINIGKKSSKGVQVWMAENMNVGKMILGADNQTNNNKVEKYCYNNDSVYCNTYGGLYQWDEIMKFIYVEGTQGICPSGWHLPTNLEWSTFTNAIGGDAAAYASLAEPGTAHWIKNFGNNSTGFTALPAGFYMAPDYFSNLQYLTCFWTSTWIDSNQAYGRNLHGLDSFSTRVGTRSDGYSVRCLKN